MMNTLIGLGVLVILVIAGLTAWRMTLTGRVRARDHRRLKLVARQRAQTIHTMTQKINAYRPSLDIVGTSLVDELAELVHRCDVEVQRLNAQEDDK